MTGEAEALAVELDGPWMSRGLCDRAATLLRSQQARIAELEAEREWRPTHRHVGRGTDYRLVSSAVLQTEQPIGDNEFLALYQGEDGLYWVRPADEFKDGRFVPLPPRPSDAGGA